MQETLRLHEQNNNEQLKELISRSEDLKDMLQKERNRKDHFRDRYANFITVIIEALQKQLEAVEQEIKDRFDKCCKQFHLDRSFYNA